MKKIIIALICIAFFSTNSYAQQKLNINTQKSTIKWIGENTFYFGGHNGIIHFKEGYFIKTNDKITGGSFIIDMNTIASIEKNKPDYDNGLVNHLKNEDFFDVEKFPLARLVITNTNYHDDTHLQINGDMTIKGIKLPIKFQAEVNFEKEQMTTRFKIDRTRWGITYNSKLKDKAISDAIGFEISIKL